VEELEQRAVSVIEKDDENEVFEVTASDLIPIDLANFIVSTGLGLYLKMLLVDGLMHADLHP
jgi:predicted unusual protein kinase regulating ubiquinone biosynthesis (AarF/ABC1/UbiB family)